MNSREKSCALRFIEEETRRCLRVAGMEHVTIRSELNSRFTARLGDALVTSKPPKAPAGRCRYSIPLWPKATSEERLNVVRHEVAHVLADLKYGRRCAHDGAWRSMFLSLGGDGKRTHSVANEEIQARRKAKRAKRRARPKVRDYLITCLDCSQRLRVGTRQAAMIRNGTRTYSCGACGSPITHMSIAAAEAARGLDKGNQ